MALLKDLIEIPERVHQGDFVLKLSEGVSHAEQTLRDYVVTPQLVYAFGNALGFIQQAVLTGSSKAAYLHGSFGSGKSHFMAVLNLLLAGNTQARATPELADVVARNGWTAGRKFLLVPYHMVGARDMESAVLGQYAEFVRKLHPTAPVPGFYLAEGLFKDASELRARMGDESFFAKLNEGASKQGDGGGEQNGRRGQRHDDSPERSPVTLTQAASSLNCLDDVHRPDHAGAYVSRTMSPPRSSVATRRSGGRGPAKKGVPRPSTKGWK